LTEKNLILDHLKRIAKANGGKAPGELAFKRETSIGRSDWFPHVWLRWSDAIVEAGFEANQFGVSISKDVVVNKFIELTRELGRIPIKGELLRKAKIDKTFPNAEVFYSEGKEGLLKRVAQYCEAHPSNEDILALCRIPKVGVESEKKVKIETGFVYLMRSGRHHKIGRTNSLGSRERQLAIKIPVPPTTVHSIETDDPVGVEAYWHKRLAEKRGEGEWFDLTSDDIAAFKRWKRIA
jgi:hypothetical protein